MRHRLKSIWNDIFSQPGFVAFTEGQGKFQSKIVPQIFLVVQALLQFWSIKFCVRAIQRGVMYLFLVGQKQLLPQASGKPERPFEMRLIHFLPNVVITISIKTATYVYDICPSHLKYPPDSSAF